MKTEELNKVMAWIRTTDLVELSFKARGAGFAFSTSKNTAPASGGSFSGSRLTPVTSPGVGIFQWNALGKAPAARQGDAIGEGDLLGLIDSGLKTTTQVKAPCAGKLTKVCIEAGKPVQYGQPLFFIE